MSRRKTNDEFKRELKEVHGDRFDLLSEYVNNCTKVKLKCNICGNVIEKMPSKLVTSSKEGCYICSKKNRYKTSDVLQKEIDSISPGEYTIVGKYIGSRKKIMVIRNDCNHTYDITPDNLLRGRGCPKCGIRQSHYMDIVERYLDDNNIHYVKEKTFEDCRFKRCLPFDYYIPSQNVCIEVDGEFHFNRKTKSFSLASSYEETKKRDAIKGSYCKRNKIKLIRLPFYLKDSFIDILDKELYVNTEITN